MFLLSIILAVDFSAVETTRIRQYFETGNVSIPHTALAEIPGGDNMDYFTPQSRPY